MSRRVRYRTMPDPAVIGPLLREAGFVGSEADPVECSASFDGSNNPILIVARYADGWVCKMSFGKGGVSLTQSITMTTRKRVVKP
jgi:hypothetical protein